MVQRKKNLVVQWRDDGTWLSSCVYLSGAYWRKKQKQAKRFRSQTAFKKYCEDAFREPFASLWPAKSMRFVRLIPRRGASK